MSYAALDAARVARACKSALTVLESSDETSEAHVRKTLMVQRIAALAEGPRIPAGGAVVTLDVGRVLAGQQELVSEGQTHMTFT
jgi:hypothetical protein